MIDVIAGAIMRNKTYLLVAVAALAIIGYAIPYGIGVQALPGINHGLHYGLINGDGYGLSCDHFKPGKGPVRCR
jgi:hypothetical protein